MVKKEKNLIHLTTTYNLITITIITTTYTYFTVVVIVIILILCILRVFHEHFFKK